MEFVCLRPDPGPAVDVVDGDGLFRLARRLVRERGMSQADVARLLGVSPVTVGKALRQPTTRYTGTVVRIVEALGVEVVGPLWGVRPVDGDRE